TLELKRENETAKDVNDIAFFILANSKDAYTNVENYSVENGVVNFTMPKVDTDKYYPQIMDKQGRVYSSNDNQFIDVVYNRESRVNELFPMIKHEVIEKVTPAVKQYVMDNKEEFSIKGDKGDKGEKGDRGERGKQGYKGNRGEKGDKGERGEQGPQGERGERGFRGNRGPEGPQGPIGPQGPKGVDGTVEFSELTQEQIEMIRGPQGEQGPEGPEGTEGTEGPKGEQGPEGPKGEVTNEQLEELHINIKRFGAVGDGVADDTQAIKDTIEHAESVGSHTPVFIPHGIYKTSETITCSNPLYAQEATINYNGTGTALVIGDESEPGIVTARRKFSLPRVINKLRGSDGWDSTSIGVKCVNLNTCEIYVPFIQDFE